MEGKESKEQRQRGDTAPRRARSKVQGPQQLSCPGALPHRAEPCSFLP